MGQSQAFLVAIWLNSTKFGGCICAKLSHLAYNPDSDGGNLYLQAGNRVKANLVAGLEKYGRLGLR